MSKSIACVAVAAALTLLAPLLAAQESGVQEDRLIDMQQRYPSGSILSEKMADRALQDVKNQRALIKQRYKDEERTCYREHFFANHCSSEALKRRNSALNATDSVRIEARRFKRRTALERREIRLKKNEKRAVSNSQESTFSDLSTPPKSAPQHATLSAEELAKNEAAYARKLQRFEERKRRQTEKKANKSRP